jgi:hypothetical protein
VQSYARSYETDFEEYSGRDLQSIYIGIKDWHIVLTKVLNLKAKSHILSLPIHHK